MKLTTLEHRRKNGDMIGVYKYMHGNFDPKLPKFTLSSMKALHGNSLKFQKDRFRLNVGENFFTSASFVWNGLPDKIFTVPSVNTFKNTLDNHHWKD